MYLKTHKDRYNCCLMALCQGSKCLCVCCAAAEAEAPAPPPAKLHSLSLARRPILQLAPDVIVTR